MAVEREIIKSVEIPAEYSASWHSAPTGDVWLAHNAPELLMLHRQAEILYNAQKNIHETLQYSGIASRAMPALFEVSVQNQKNHAHLVVAYRDEATRDAAKAFVKATCELMETAQAAHQA
jgi:hypothetical protein